MSAKKAAGARTPLDPPRGFINAHRAAAFAKGPANVAQATDDAANTRVQEGTAVGRGAWLRLQSQQATGNGVQEGTAVGSGARLGLLSQRRVNPTPGSSSGTRGSVIQESGTTRDVLFMLTGAPAAGTAQDPVTMYSLDNEEAENDEDSASEFMSVDESESSDAYVSDNDEDLEDEEQMSDEDEEPSDVNVHDTDEDGEDVLFESHASAIKTKQSCQSTAAQKWQRQTFREDKGKSKTVKTPDDVMEHPEAFHVRAGKSAAYLLTGGQRP
ncbi:hypothetical protein MMC25_002645 [Agyrium rufum]|nr:hypothetical protein [Agyrium rufum]